MPQESRSLDRPSVLESSVVDSSSKLEGNPARQAASPTRSRGLTYALHKHRLAFAFLTVEALCGGVLAVAGRAGSVERGTRVGLVTAIVLFVATALKTITKSASEIADNEEKLIDAEGKVVDAQQRGEVTLRVATVMQEYFAERIPSLLDYLGTLITSTSTDERKAMAESLESIVVDSAASLYGKKDLRAVVLHFWNGGLIPGNFRRGFESATVPRLDGTGPAVLRAKQLIREKKMIWVDTPDDPRHIDSLILRPSDSFRSFVRVPIVAGEFGFGILWVDGRNDRSLMEADVAPLSALAGVLATALAVTAAPEARMSGSQ